jgi:hypothetical protein
MLEHIALMGDSIFDNASYTEGEPDVITHLREVLPDGYAASLLAVDGSTTSDLEAQLASLPADVSRVVVSVGGNDALLNADIINQPVESTREALHLFGQRIAMFEESYRAAILGVTRRVAQVTVCTIYNGNLPRVEAPSARVALMLFNDVILRVAFQLRLDVIDLRLICAEPSDYANPIEPSGQGGKKIADAIASSLGLLRESRSTSQVYAG